MKINDIYFKTMKFVWMKLGLGAATFALSALLMAALFGVALLFNNTLALIICFGLWIAGTTVINNILNHYVGYLIKAGHVAIITQAVTTGTIPENQFETAKSMVQSRFLTSNVYFAVDRLVSGAVRQIQNGLTTVDNLMGNIPGISGLISFAKVFVGIALGYVDECCLGYTFYHTQDGAFKSAADGVVIYFQNWKTLLKNAAVMSLMVILLTAAAWILPFLVVSALFRVLSWPMWIGFFLSVLVALILKSAFIDSYMLVKMMVSYMETAPQTQITFDLYGKLCKLSSKFKGLFEQGQAESPVAVAVDNPTATL